MPLEPFRILLVEDSSGDVYLLRKALESAGLDFELTVIDNGASALEFVRGAGAWAGSAVPQLAIIDLSLPKNDGIQVVEAIRAAERFAGMPVVVMSSSARPPTPLNLEHLQVTPEIPKPPDQDEVLRIGVEIKELLEGQASRA